MYAKVCFKLILRGTLTRPPSLTHHLQNLRLVILEPSAVCTCDEAFKSHVREDVLQITVSSRTNLHYFGKTILANAKQSVNE